jgi:hypothetical protein
MIMANIEKTLPFGGWSIGGLFWPVKKDFNYSAQLSIMRSSPHAVIGNLVFEVIFPINPHAGADTTKDENLNQVATKRVAKTW